MNRVSFVIYAVLSVTMPCLDSQGASIGHVVTPGPVWDDNGNQIGYIDSKGKVISKGRKDLRVGKGGVVTDGKGKRVGFVTNGEIVQAPKMPKRVLTADGCVHVDANVLNQRMLEPGESIPVCGKSAEEVMNNVQVMFGEACKANQEQILYAVRTPDGRYELRRGDMKDGTDKEAYFRPRLAKGEIIIGIIHDHPAGGLWPSETDAITALKYDTNIYVHDCRSDKMSVAYMHKPKGDREGYWKKVMLVEGGKPVSELGEPKSGGYCDGHDPYDEAQYERYAANRLSASCVVDERKASGSVGATKAGNAGGYCQCASPQVFGERVRESRSRRRKGEVKHYGVVGFICAGCGKINQAMYARAQSLKAKQTSEGVPTFWMDIQLQQLENYRQASNMTDAERQKLAESMFKSLQAGAGGRP